MFISHTYTEIEEVKLSQGLYNLKSVKKMEQLRIFFAKRREDECEARVRAVECIASARLVTREILDGRFEGFFLLVA